MCIGIHTYIQNRHNIIIKNRAAKLKKWCVYAGMGTDFEKKNSSLCGDTADFTPPPPYLGQDFVQSPVIDMCSSTVLHWLPTKKIRKIPIPIPVYVCRKKGGGG